MYSTDRIVCQRCCNPLKLSPDLEILQHDKILALNDAQRPERDDSQPPPIVVPVKNTGTATYPCYRVPPSPFAINSEADALAILHAHSTPSTSMDHRQKVSSSLFDILSGRTNVDHPLCQECADVLITAKQKCLQYQEDELACLRAYLARLEQKAAGAHSKPTDRISIASANSVQSTDAASSLADDSNTTGNWLSCISTSQQSGCTPPVQPAASWRDYSDSEADDDEDVEEVMATAENQLKPIDDDSDEDYSANKQQNIAAHGSPSIKGGVPGQRKNKYQQATLEELQATVGKLRAKLDNVLAEGAKLDRQLVSDEAELKHRGEELDKAYTQYNAQKLALLEEEEELYTLESRVKRSERHLQLLLRTNVLNTAFPIWYDGHFCIINGLHLGRLANRPISWDEINAAWGQCAMLLQCIAKKLNLTFRELLIIPMGSQSKVIDLPNNKEYPLYYTTTGMQLFAASKFDNAMCLFLKCLHQVQQCLEGLTQTKLPYRIRDGGKMFDPKDGRSYSIKWTGNAEENWTKALKMMLLNMKWIIARLAAIDGANKSLSKETRSAATSPETEATSAADASSK